AFQVSSPRIHGTESPTRTRARNGPLWLSLRFAAQQLTRVTGPDARMGDSQPPDGGRAGTGLRLWHHGAHGDDEADAACGPEVGVRPGARAPEHPRPAEARRERAARGRPRPAAPEHDGRARMGGGR